MLNNKGAYIMKKLLLLSILFFLITCVPILRKGIEDFLSQINRGVENGSLQVVVNENYGAVAP